jgi:glutathione S-transferase
MMGYGNVERALNTLEAAISDADYLAGDTFTAVDLYVGSHLNFGMMFGTIDKRPAFERYVGRLIARPAFGRATQLDNDLMQRAAS